MINPDCKCCRKFGRTGDMWHCEYCWNKFHNGLRDNDWEDEETFRKKRGEEMNNMKERTIEGLAEWMHNEYEKASKVVGWDTQKSCKVKFKDLPEENRKVMLIVAEKVAKLLRSVIGNHEKDSVKA